jgi:hypothetical protein
MSDRFWVTTLDPESVPEHNSVKDTFGSETVGVVDEEQGGVIAYAGQDNAEMIRVALARLVSETT